MCAVRIGNNCVRRRLEYRLWSGLDRTCLEAGYGPPLMQEMAGGSPPLNAQITFQPRSIISDASSDHIGSLSGHTRRSARTARAPLDGARRIAHRRRE